MTMYINPKRNRRSEKEKLPKQFHVSEGRLKNEATRIADANREREKPKDVDDVAAIMFDGADPADVLEAMEDLDDKPDEQA